MPFLFSPEIRSESYAFFAAMNTPKGFVSHFGDTFAAYHSYIVKGGPGTGKSTLMKKIAREGEKRGLSVTYYYCSSDTTSLDAVTVDELHVAVLDGTAPHAIEPALVGVKDHYLDLSQFLSPKLIENKDQIRALSEEKSEAYRRAYRLLSALQTLDTAFVPIREREFDREKCHKALCRLLDGLHLEKEAAPNAKKAQISAIGGNGYTAINGFCEKTRLFVQVSDRHGVSPYLFAALCDMLDKRSISYSYSLSPLTLSVDTVFIAQKGILLSSLPLWKEPAVTVNCERFLRKRGQGMYKGEKPLLTAEKLLYDSAIAAFRDAQNAHREAERHYIGAMNFAALNTYTEALIRELFHT